MTTRAHIDNMAVLKGYVEHIIYRNEANRYTVLELDCSGEEYTLVGIFPSCGEGELIEAEGSFTSHPVYGEQFQVESVRSLPPEDTDSMVRYLGSGAIKGIGPSLAQKIVKKFKLDTFRIIEEEPERLAEIKDIVDIPLVLHGASGVPVEQVKKAIELGITKVNIATELKMPFAEKLREEEEK